MIRQTLAAGALLLATIPIAVPATAQSQQDELDTRYDRALAAGYKALFLCSAIANAERAGTTRTPQSVHDWELTGIQAPLDDIVRELPYEIMRNPAPDAQIRGVKVEWAEDMPPRLALHDSQRGCSIMPIGGGGPPVVTLREAPDMEMAWPEAQASAVLDATVATAFEQEEGIGPRTTAVVVLQDGEIAAERYAEGFNRNTPQRTWSVAKSITATLVGAAVHRGEAKVDNKMGNGLPHAVLPEWSKAGDARMLISIDHLLRMASGRYSDTPGNRTDPLYFGGSSVEETAVHWPLVHKPGTVYRYANNDTLMAVKAIAWSFDQHPPSAFFDQVGMNHTVAETDWEGSYVLSSQVWSTARDLALFGQLYLDDGVLPDGTRILPEGWVEYVSSPSGPQPEGRGFGYGAGFWLLNASEGIPSDTFAALGNRGQHVVIVPSRKIVIVRRGEDPAGTRFDIEAFTRSVLKAIED
ncbi:serine hydrolase [Erythrobacter sp. HKB08]|uniref:serine hydrolase domain-containing protein n=1 Tax=Erythrobacter sp. HKB08 TaxID=2502843 RepID=UPI0010087EBC|nr:serine hydrolase [Erythrobacter sp. HKB08]